MRLRFLYEFLDSGVALQPFEFRIPSEETMKPRISSLVFARLASESSRLMHVDTPNCPHDSFMQVFNHLTSLCAHGVLFSKGVLRLCPTIFDPEPRKFWVTLGRCSVGATPADGSATHASLVTSAAAARALDLMNFNLMAPAGAGGRGKGASRKCDECHLTHFAKKKNLFSRGGCTASKTHRKWKERAESCWA